MKRLNRLEIESIVVPIIAKIKKDREGRRTDWAKKLNPLHFKVAARAIKAVNKDFNFVFDGNYNTLNENDLIERLKDDFTDLNYSESIEYKSRTELEYEVIRVSSNYSTFDEIENAISIYR